MGRTEHFVSGAGSAPSTTRPVVESHRNMSMDAIEAGLHVP
jgi:hypothetical protein